MEVVLLFAAGFAPGAFWLWYFYRKDRYEREPHGLVLRTAFFGVLCAIPVTFIEMPFENFFIAAVIVAPIVEEFAKFAVVRWTIYDNPEFDEPMDGVVYAAAAALGFASIENVGYIAEHYFDKGMGAASGVFVARAVLSVPGHVLFSSLWGYALGRAKFQPPEMRQRTIVLGLGLAMIGHSLFNLFLIIGLALTVVFLLLPYLWKRFNRNVDELLSGSPFRTPPGRIATVSAGDQKAHEFFLAGSSQPQSDFHSHPAPASTRNQLEPHSEEGTPLQHKVLPHSLLCISCDESIELSAEEQSRGWFLCPSCGFFNAGRMNLIAPSDVPILFRLKPFVECPSCASELHLEHSERADGVFECGHCNSRTDIHLPDAASLKQYILPAKGECPACQGGFVIEEYYRNSTSFECPSCHTTIEYAEE